MRGSLFLPGTARVADAAGKRSGRLVALSLAAMVLGCGGPTATDFEAILDEVDLSVWRLAHTTVTSTDTGCIRALNPYCPSVFRYYLAEERPADSFAVVKAAMVAAGFVMSEEQHPECDVQSSGPACSMSATRNGARVDVNVHEPGDDVDGLGIESDGQSIVRIVIRPA